MLYIFCCINKESTYLDDRIPSKPVEDFNTDGVTSLDSPKTASEHEYNIIHNTLNLKLYFYPFAK